MSTQWTLWRYNHGLCCASLGIVFPPIHICLYVCLSVFQHQFGERRRRNRDMNSTAVSCSIKVDESYRHLNFLKNAWFPFISASVKYKCKWIGNAHHNSDTFGISLHELLCTMKSALLCTNISSGSRIAQKFSSNDAVFCDMTHIEWETDRLQKCVLIFSDTCRCLELLTNWQDVLGYW